MYKSLLVQTYWNRGELSDAAIRVRPLPGQGLDPTLNVECSRSMRTAHPVGTIFMIDAKLSFKGETPYLSSHYTWPYTIVSKEDAARHLSALSTSDDNGT